MQCLPFYVCLISISIMSSGFLHVVKMAGFPHFKRLSNIPLYIYIYIYFITYICDVTVYILYIYIYHKQKLFTSICSNFTLVFLIFLFFVAWGLELRASYLLGRCSATWATPPALILHIWCHSLHLFKFGYPLTSYHTSGSS
jgi:hypothetical protein